MVLPLVPVTPTRVSRDAGSPSTAAENAASALRASGTWIQGPPGWGGFSDATAAAPLRRAASTN